MEQAGRNGRSEGEERRYDGIMRQNRMERRTRGRKEGVRERRSERYGVKVRGKGEKKEKYMNAEIGELRDSVK